MSIPTNHVLKRMNILEATKTGHVRNFAIFFPLFRDGFLTLVALAGCTHESSLVQSSQYFYAQPYVPETSQWRYRFERCRM